MTVFAVVLRAKGITVGNVDDLCKNAASPKIFDATSSATTCDVHSTRCGNRSCRIATSDLMKSITPSSLIILASLFSAVFPANAQVNVTLKQNNLSRDGLYLDSAFTPSAAASVTRDLNFNGTISGNVYAQPLYIENGPGGLAMVIVVTESNNVYALNATTGTVIWKRMLAPPSAQVCPAAILSRSVSPAHPLSISPPGHSSSMP